MLVTNGNDQNCGAKGFLRYAYFFMKMIRQKIVEIRAPHYGLVEDVNIYGIDVNTVKMISGILKKSHLFINQRLK